MSCFDRRAALTILAGGLAGCGFRPLYGEGGPADAVLGAVALQEALSPEDFAYRERLRRRLDLQSGDASAAWRLTWALDFESEGVAITSDADTTRYRLTGTARYALSSLRDAAAAPIRGKVSVTGAYDATASAYATRAAETAERREISTELAELTATRLLSSPRRPVS
ncbi:LPS assembly lipoprotein LptE [Pikeienuella sp. HZG-20]|uniref:LPS assembly lipoprotein LptE n=1 Tax=Paludibacillus litoralis TaxID=3133267 RepID=UPI0030EEE3A1